MVSISLFKMLLNLLLIYLGLTILFYVLSQFMMFFPPSPTQFIDTAQTIKIRSANDKKISAIYLKNPNAKYTLLFSHGNAEDLGYLMPWLELYYQHGFSIIAYDYQGYGTSEGRTSEKNTYADIMAVYQYLIHDLKVPPEDIVILGRSIGTGPSIYLASQVQSRALIIESPPLSAYRIYTMIPIFPFDKYPNLKMIDKVTVPILVIHGTEDKGIPFWHGKKIYSAIKGKKAHYWVQGAGHNDIHQVAGENYWRAIDEFLKNNE